MVLISRTHSFTQAHIRWLEWRAISATTDAKRYKLNNGNAGGEPFVTEPIRADVEEIFETGALLLESLGYPVFRPYLTTPAGTNLPADSDIWFLSGPDADARAQFTDSGFVVLKGSKSRTKFSKAAQSTGFAQNRDRLLADGLLKPDGESLIFNEDIPFRSPSGAAAIVLARHANGWISWRNAKGETLDIIKRQAPE